MRRVVTADGRITARRSATGRARSHFWYYEDRDARPVRCNGWLSTGRPRCENEVDHHDTLQIERHRRLRSLQYRSKRLQVGRGFDGSPRRDVAREVANLAHHV